MLQDEETVTSGTWSLPQEGDGGIASSSSQNEWLLVTRQQRGAPPTIWHSEE